MSRTVVKPLFRSFRSTAVLPRNSYQSLSALDIHTSNGVEASPSSQGRTSDSAATSDSPNLESVANASSYNLTTRMRGPLNHVSSEVLHNHPARAFSTSTRLQRDHHFDTLKFVRRLESEGLSSEQAQALMSVLSDVIEESIQNLTRTMVLREDALKTSYTQKVDFSALRTELLSLDSSEASLTRASHERISNELQKLRERLRDETSRTQASVRLDLNLEKGRIREEANAQELRIKETDTRIEQEVANLRERVEGVKFDTLRWLAGVSTGTAALLLGAWRLFM